MTQYVAFLRGVNVGGKKPIKMKELAAVVSAAGFHNVRTIVASGNVIFEASEKDPARIARVLERRLLKSFRHEIVVIIRTIDELRAIIKLNPFKKSKPSVDEMLFVTFFASPLTESDYLKVKPGLPLRSETDKMELIALTDRAAFILAQRKKTGWFGFPHAFAEKLFKVPTTTRNWTTIAKIVAAAERK